MVVEYPTNPNSVPLTSLHKNTIYIIPDDDFNLGSSINFEKCVAFISIDGTATIHTPDRSAYLILHSYAGIIDNINFDGLTSIV